MTFCSHPQLSAHVERCYRNGITDTLTAVEQALGINARTAVEQALGINARTAVEQHLKQQHDDNDTPTPLDPQQAEYHDAHTRRHPLPLHRTEAGWPQCATCDGGGCPDCTDPT